STMFVHRRRSSWEAAHPTATACNFRTLCFAIPDQSPTHSDKTRPLPSVQNEHRPHSTMTMLAARPPHRCAQMWCRPAEGWIPNVESLRARPIPPELLRVPTSMHRRATASEPYQFAFEGRLPNRPVHQD